MVLTFVDNVGNALERLKPDVSILLTQFLFWKCKIVLFLKIIYGTLLS